MLDFSRERVTDTKERQSPRLAASLPVQVVGARGTDGVTTVDVSRGGLFVRTASPRPLRQLVRLRIDPGGGQAHIAGHGMVVRVVQADEAKRTGAEPGMGIEFYGFGGGPRERWDDLIERIAKGATAGRRTSQVPPRGLQPVRAEAAYRLPGRKHILVLLGIENVEQLDEICEHHLLAPTLLVETSADLTPGEPLDLRVPHPLSREIYDLPGKVAARSKDPAGLVIELTPGVETRQAQFRGFIERGLPEEELALELVE